MHFQGTYFSLPSTEIYSDETLIKAQVSDDVMFCCCPVDSVLCIPMSKKCVGGTTTGMMYVGMLLLYSHVKLSACNDGEPVSCRPYHRMQKKKKKKRNRHERSRCLKN